MAYELRSDGYPKTWPEISKRIIARDGNCCTMCGLRNHLVGHRDGGRFVPTLRAAPDLFPVLRKVWPTSAIRPEFGALTIWHLRVWVALLNRATPLSGKRRWLWVKLGVAHLDSLLVDHRDENLAALCAQCHLSLDRPVSVPRAVASRKYGSGRAKSMQPLFPDNQ